MKTDIGSTYMNNYDSISIELNLQKQVRKSPTHSLNEQGNVPSLPKEFGTKMEGICP